MGKACDRRGRGGKRGQELDELPLAAVPDLDRRHGLERQLVEGVPEDIRVDLLVPPVEVAPLQGQELVEQARRPGRAPGGHRERRLPRPPPGAGSRSTTPSRRSDGFPGSRPMGLPQPGSARRRARGGRARRRRARRGPSPAPPGSPARARRPLQVGHDLGALGVVHHAAASPRPGGLPPAARSRHGGDRRRSSHAGRVEAGPVRALGAPRRTSRRRARRRGRSGCRPSCRTYGQEDSQLTAVQLPLLPPPPSEAMASAAMPIATASAAAPIRKPLVAFSARPEPLDGRDLLERAARRLVRWSGPPSLYFLFSGGAAASSGAPARPRRHIQERQPTRVGPGVDLGGTDGERRRRRSGSRSGRWATRVGSLSSFSLRKAHPGRTRGAATCAACRWPRRARRPEGGQAHLALQRGARLSVGFGVLGRWHRVQAR